MNVLVHAHRRDESCREAYRDWTHDLATGDEPFGLSVLAAVGFVRIVTNPRVFAEPTPLPVAVATMDALAAREGCRMVGPGPRHWELTRKLCTAIAPRTGATGGASRR